MEIVQEAFERVRGERFFIQDNMPEFRLRIPWLFPANGCFVRAALVKRALEKRGYPPVNKVFLFGGMSLNSEFPVQSKITYKDHVATGLRVRDKAYVIDPPVMFGAPLELTAWTNILGTSKYQCELKVSICSAVTFSHNSNHAESDPTFEVGIRQGVAYSVEYFVQEFIRKERVYLQELEFDVDRLLGAEPPWM